jgi:gliding motility-associated-like protein
MKNKFLAAIVGFFIAHSAMSQSITITDPDFGPTNPINCSSYQDGGAINFFDNGGSANYAPNSADTITICPDISNQTTWPKVSVTFATNIGFTFDINPSDTLYIFDGPNTSAPLLTALNTGVNATGGSYGASFVDNPSGCLTFVFHSDATNEGTGWGAGITCGNPAQPFYPHLEAFVNGSAVNSLNPLDTGYVDVCLYDTIMIVAKPVFPYAFEQTGIGYQQNLTNITYDWNVTGNGPLNVNNDTVYFVPQTRNGFYVTLKMTDIFPQLVQTFCKIRVSQLPSFAGTGPVDPLICINESTTLIGGTTAQDTVGVAFPQGNFVLGGTVAGLTYLPDGNGQQYTTTINMTDFPAGSTFSSASDLQEICLTMEHSFLGDLEVWLTCPNGTSVWLINAYTGAGPLTGGFGGGGTFLGSANDNGNGTPGIGWEYCFSSVNNTFGTMATEYAAGNTVPTFTSPTTSAGNAMNPNGVYQPNTTFAGFNGCPLNGPWTVHVQDNQGIDDGYIFEWSLLFDASLFPNSETYQNHIENEYWMNSPYIISGMNDTLITVLPPGPGSYNFVYVVEDNFGCIYDTTVNVMVNSPINLNLPTEICQYFYTSTLSTGTNDGMWSFYDSPATPTFLANNVNTTFNFPAPGLYHLVYSDTSCTNKDTAIINVLDAPNFNFSSDFFNCPNETEHLVFNDSLLVAEFHWGLANPAQDTLFQANLATGTYTASYTTPLGCVRDTTFTITTQPETILFNYADVCTNTINMNLNTGYPNGVWNVIGSPNNNTVVFSSPNTLQTSATIAAYGTYVFTYTESGCNQTDTVDIKFTPFPWFSISDTSTCFDVPFTFTAIDTGYIDNYSWSNGTLGNTMTTNIAGQYILTGTNVCGTFRDTANLTVIPGVSLFDYPDVCGDSTGLVLNTGFPTGHWSVISNPGTKPVIFSNQDSLQSSIKVQDYGTYTIIFDQDVCSDVDTLQIKFTPYPWLSIPDGETCIGDPLTIASYDFGFIDNYTWNTGATGPQIATSVQGYYILTGTNECGSYSDTAFLLTDVCVIDFPNVFSPDGNAENPVFTSLQQPDGFKDFKCQIFNRWGDLMHEYDSVFGFWDGKTNGQEASEGVYFYSVKATTVNGKDLTRQGFFHLIRTND